MSDWVFVLQRYRSIPRPRKKRSRLFVFRFGNGIYHAVDTEVVLRWCQNPQVFQRLQSSFDPGLTVELPIKTVDADVLEESCNLRRRPAYTQPADRDQLSKGAGRGRVMHFLGLELKSLERTDNVRQEWRVAISETDPERCVTVLRIVQRASSVHDHADVGGALGGCPVSSVSSITAFLEVAPSERSSPLTHCCACCNQSCNSVGRFCLCPFLVAEALMPQVMLDYDVQVASGTVQQRAVNGFSC